MKLLSLNTWAGKEFDKLIKFISDKSQEIDVFCFQEVFHTLTENKIVNEHYRANLFSELSKILPDHKGYFAPAREGHGFNSPIGFQIAWGLAMFVKRSIEIKETGEVFIRGYKNSKGSDNTTVPRNLQYLLFSNKGKEYTIAHFHGLWNGKGKTDTDERLEQSRKIKNFTNEKEKLVLCGDFNLLPDTKSLEMLEENLINLIKTHKIKSTRSKLYAKLDKFTDYTLVSKDIKVEKFEVPEVEISDHLPMILDFT